MKRVIVGHCWGLGGHARPCCKQSSCVDMVQVLFHLYNVFITRCSGFAKNILLYVGLHLTVAVSALLLLRPSTIICFCVFYVFSLNSFPDKAEKHIGSNVVIEKPLLVCHWKAFNIKQQQKRF